MQSSGVPTQGIVLTETTSAKRRGDAGILGKGTPGSRLKNRYRKAMYLGSLRSYVRTVEGKSADAIAWLNSKSGS